MLNKLVISYTFFSVRYQAENSRFCVEVADLIGNYFRQCIHGLAFFFPVIDMSSFDSKWTPRYQASLNIFF